MNMDAVTFELSIMIGICILFEQPTAGAAVSIENKIPFFFITNVWLLMANCLAISNIFS